MTIYEYVSYTQPDIIEKFKRLNLLDIPIEVHITFKQAILLMRHDKWKRVNRRVHQVYPGMVV
ncbi:hypothetical protein [Mahella australiensis]|uniref:Uncharacterized protein n=1 Tax=Mahella australiensis (strain DSM 15567 / CIP 107919 / 50-1 BON) TaxID=697281 RepID=F4A0W4_MAHA5|nr:hypothetical protein [Mahella australiensis]AEE98041.1 hypothetical protein Mahau_2920 [Mahella australiensis 50-1 BON]